MIILIVDDNDQNIYQLQVLLGANGYQVATATNGAEALTQARQNPPDFIVSDILMPVMDGFTLCRECKKDERLRSVPFIFYTATYTDERDRELALSLGAARFLVKPEEPDVFMQAIRDVLAQVPCPPAAPPAAPSDREAGFLKQYNETLIRKLETKMQQLEQVNRELAENLAKRKAHEREIERLTRLYATLSQINQAIIRVTSREELLREICQVTSNFGGFKAVWIGVCDPETRRVMPAARSGVEGYLDTIPVYADGRPEGRGPVGTCIREGKPCIVNDFLNAPKTLPWHEAAQTYGIRAAAAFPIHFKGAVWGAFTVYDGEANVFQDREIALLVEAASDISYAMDHLQQEERHRSILQTAMDGIWQADTQGRLLEVNTAYCRMSGYSEQELLTLRISDLEAEETADGTATHIKKIIAQGQVRFESRHRRKDGSLFCVEISAQYQPDDGGRIVAFVRDITERKRTEDELQKLDKLQSVGTLAGGIAHDFNNILQGLYGNISLALEDLSKTHPSYALLEEADKSMTRAVRLTKQLLTFAKGGDPVKEAISLKTMAEEVARFDLTGSNVSLVCQPAEDVWPVDADRGQLQQVVSNLVINARQAMPKGGKLTITLENADLPADAVPTLKQGRYVKVRVQDEGVGITPQVIDHIFDPYFTTKHTGSGLGLATVWSIINKHGGHISVISELGKGTTFTFFLPASSSLLPSATQPPAAEGPAPTRPAKILIMEDDESVNNLVVCMLKPSGYTVATAANAQETIALYKQALDTGTPFDAVIMDLTIPGGPGGQEVIQDLLALDPGVRAIVSSGYAGDPVMANFADYGFKGVVAKPYTVRALREAVARVLA